MSTTNENKIFCNGKVCVSIKTLNTEMVYYSENTISIFVNYDNDFKGEKIQVYGNQNFTVCIKDSNCEFTFITNMLNLKIQTKTTQENDEKTQEEPDTPESEETDEFHAVVNLEDEVQQDPYQNVKSEKEKYLGFDNDVELY